MSSIFFLESCSVTMNPLEEQKLLTAEVLDTFVRLDVARVND